MFRIIQTLLAKINKTASSASEKDVIEPTVTTPVEQTSSPKPISSAKPRAKTKGTKIGLIRATKPNKNSRSTKKK